MKAKIDLPQIAIGKDADLVASMAMQSGELVGVITTNKSNYIHSLEKKGLRTLSLNQEVRRICGRNYWLSMNESDLHASITNNEIKNFPPLPLGFSEKARTLIEEQLELHSALAINPYQNSQYLEEFVESYNKKGKVLELIGPKNKVREFFDNKITAHDLFEKSEIQVPESHILSKEEATDFIDANPGTYFVSAEFGAGGDGAAKINSPEQLMYKFADYSGKLLVQKWLSVKNSPNVLALVDDEPRVLAITDQILHGIEYYGNRFPADLSQSQFETVVQESEEIGELMYERGYRGLTGFDWMILQDGSVVFGEINPRWNHSTAQNSFFIEKRAKTPPAALLEYMALMEKGYSIKKVRHFKGEYWAMKLFKVGNWTRISGKPTLNVNDSNFFEISSTTLFSNFPTPDTIIPRVYSHSKGEESISSAEPKRINICRQVVKAGKLMDLEENLRRSERFLQDNFLIGGGNDLYNWL